MTDEQLQTENVEFRVLLMRASMALDDWIVTYASDHCYPEQIESTQKRISAGGGTLAYVSDITDAITKALLKSSP